MLDYTDTPESRVDHTYSMLLIVLAIWHFLGAICFVFAAIMPTNPAYDHSSIWVFELCVAMSLLIRQ
jgi:hypothetical protein